MAISVNLTDTAAGRFVHPRLQGGDLPDRHAAAGERAHHELLLREVLGARHRLDHRGRTAAPREGDARPRAAAPHAAHPGAHQKEAEKILFARVTASWRSRLLTANSDLKPGARRHRRHLFRSE